MTKLTNGLQIQKLFNSFYSVGDFNDTEWVEYWDIKMTIYPKNKNFILKIKIL
jgi:hypothetical protein